MMALTLFVGIVIGFLLGAFVRGSYRQARPPREDGEFFN